MKKILLTLLALIISISLFSQTDTTCNDTLDVGYTIMKTNVTNKDYILTKTDERGNKEVLSYDINNNLHGTCYIRDCNGKLLGLANYKHGVKHGEWKVYHINGELAYEMHYKNGEKSGTWKYYNEEGNLLKEEKF